MRLLIIDKTAEGQARCARRIEAFNQSDVEMLDLRVKLVLDREYQAQMQEADVVLLGLGSRRRRSRYSAVTADPDAMAARSDVCFR